MRYITKLHLINWHYIQYRTLDISKGVNFLTGETGSGKSTILDALQLIILGDVRGYYFNKAANDNSQRKLIEYLRGMTQDNTDEGKKYLRANMDFNSYIVIEVLNSETNETFCLGVVFEVRKDSNNPEHMFFALKQSLPENGFIKNSTPLSMRQLKDEYGSALKPYSTEEYNEHFLQEYMGKLKTGFFDIFKRSVAFKPPASIEEFIQSFICDDIKIDIETMATPIKIYKKIENEAENVKVQVEALDTISKEYRKLEEIRERLKLSKYVTDRTKLELENIETLKLMKEYKDAKEFIDRGNKRNEEIDDEIKKLQEEINDLRFKINNSPEKILKDDIQELKSKIADYKNIQNSFTAEAVKFERWINCIQNLISIYEDLKLEPDYYFSEITKLKLCNIDEDSFLKLNEQLLNIKGIINDKYAEVTTKNHRCENERKNIKEELERLLKGIVYPKSIENLKNILETELAKKYKTDIKVNILADLIDVRDKEWLDAIEGYMNWQKLYLIVEPKYYQDAINIYNSLDKNKVYDIGLVDLGKIEEANYNALKNSLAEEIITENKYARIYTDYLLGRVIKCTDIDTIRNNKTSITKDCFLYKGYIARRLSPETYKKNRCIGSESRRVRIEELNSALKVLDIDIEKLKEIEKTLKNYFDLKVYSKEDIEVKLSEQVKINQISSLEADKQQKEEELSKIDLFYVQGLNENCNKLNNDKGKLEEIRTGLLKEIGKKEEVIDNNSAKMIEQESKRQELEKLIATTYESEWRETVGEAEYNNVVTELKNYNVIITVYEEKADKQTVEEDKQFKKVVDLRGEFCVKNSLSWDMQSKDNKKYDNHLNLLNNSKMPEYIEKINLQKKKAYDAFKTDLLSRLKDAIDKTEEQITFVNRSLEKMEFGEKKYKFVVRPKAKYIDFYKMLKSDFLGMDLTAGIFEKEYKDQISFLFNIITNTTESLPGNDMEQLKKQIDVYTDYKTYLEFDMEQITATYRSDLSKTLSKNSGGETQSPFFIAVLAAFANHYRIHNAKDNNTMRLIIFDEAFSKMDEEHAMISIQLLRKFGFQAIIAAPDDKIPVIGPNVDKIFYAKNENRKNIVIAEFEDLDKENLISGNL